MSLVLRKRIMFSIKPALLTHGAVGVAWMHFKHGHFSFWRRKLFFLKGWLCCTLKLSAVQKVTATFPELLASRKGTSSLSMPSSLNLGSGKSVKFWAYAQWEANMNNALFLICESTVFMPACAVINLQHTYLKCALAEWMGKGCRLARGLIA